MAKLYINVHSDCPFDERPTLEATEVFVNAVEEFYSWCFSSSENREYAANKLLLAYAALGQQVAAAHASTADYGMSDEGLDELLATDKCIERTKTNFNLLVIVAECGQCVAIRYVND